MLGWPVGSWIALAVVVAIVVVVVARGARARAAKRADAERMAQQADASHEGAMTRHEGGA